MKRWLLVWLVLLAGCGQQKPAESPPETAIAVTVTPAAQADLEIWEESVGTLEAVNAPRLAAEVAGRIVATRVEVGDRVTPGQTLACIDPGDYRLARDLARADITRLQALLKEARLKVQRLRRLVARKSASQSTLDEAEARLGALLGQLQAARVRLQQAERDLGKTVIVSPVNGRVDARHVSVGDYVKPGSPLFDLTGLTRLRARLPYPESLAGRLRPGLPVRLSTPAAPGQAVEAVVTDLRPRIDPGSRAVEILVDFANPGDWRPGASVTGMLQVARHENAVTVPEAAVVVRPAGKVVYVIEDDRARQRVVRTGLVREGRVEILDGLAAGEPVAVDGAGFLTDGAVVEVTR
ncbi:membrane fusion protein, multidrug efflux system [Methylomarinovum caldicuralii]|uniref:Membrane fusion protein, multidrug efflux system n=1 Tax=Methylomarinovum caldicuralii TaxID=438856 RepID=A0AAU9CX04_9GAMM|nr:efflux RND transporter periplasmic adaptor subunit [Methylomarinovum caldicuralii]BCX82507.1 membrane fusion protein, multidrug efflux system [Methylomarinovum caldicuralii]